MNTKIKRFDISSVAPLFLLSFLTICIVTVLLMGAKIYRKQTERDRTGYNNRTVAQYITTRIHQSDKYNSFFIGDLHDNTPKDVGNVIYFSEFIEGTEYCTYVYCYDGYLYELFASSEIPFDPTAGERVLEVHTVTFHNNGKYITVDITHTNGSTQTILLHHRCSREKIS